MLEKNFANEDLGIELTSYIDNKQNVWFLGKDVATILGYSNTKEALKRHVSEENKMIHFKRPHCRGRETRPQQNDARVRETRPQQNDTRGKCWGPETGRQQNDTRGKYYTIINEPGFYELVFSSKLKAAKKFRQWVFTTVLPSISKYDYYKLFKIEHETRGKQRVLIGGKKYYKHPVFSNYAASKNGDIVSLKTKRILKMVNNGVGYLVFSICDEKLEKPKLYLQHRFIYEVFKGAIPRFFQIDHINNCKKDNRLKTLQLLTPTKNNQKSNNKAIISINIKTYEKKKRFYYKSGY